MGDEAFEDFFKVNPGTSDGFPANSRGSGVETTGHTRFYPISGTTDAIRLPFSPNNTDVNLGYHRVNDVGVEQWGVTWTTIAAFESVVVATLALNSEYHTSVIDGTHLYLGFYDADNVLGAAQASSYIVKALLSTGAIQSVTEIVDPVSGDATAASIHATMRGIVAGGFWDITAGGNFRFAYPTSSSVKARKGMATLELQSDLSTLVASSTVFEYETTFGVDLTASDRISYFTEDQTIFISGVGSAALLLSPGNGVAALSVAVEGDFDMGRFSLLAGLTKTETGANVNQMNHVSDDDVHLTRRMTNTVGDTNVDQAVVKPVVNRAVLDKYLKDIFLAETGIRL